MEERYKELQTQYKKVLKNYEMGLITKAECITQTEEIEDKMIEISCLSGI